MQVTPPRSTSERGFSIVEIIVAAVLVAVLIGGATAMFGSSFTTQSMTRVKDRQTTIADKMLGTLQSDSSWAVWCRNRQTPFDPQAPTCDVTTWMSTQARYADIGVVREPGQTAYRFEVTAVATGHDLDTDGTGKQDSDGVVPDLYRLTITIAPSSELIKRYPRLSVVTLQTEANPTIRVQTGRLAIDSCNVINQIDERTAVGDCTSGSGSVPLLPPPTLDTSTSASTFATCDGPMGGALGADDRDCVAYKCANPDLSSSNPGLDDPCSSFPRWRPGIARPEFTSMQIEPSTGTMSLVSVETNERFNEKLVGGHAEYINLPVGQYRIEFTQPGRELWKSKSVPSSQVVTVEAGLKSRAVIMFRPIGTGDLRIKIRTINGAGPPWIRPEFPALVSFDEAGNIVEPDETITLRMVPVPQGRLLEEDWPTLTIPYSQLSTEFHFTDVPPGLYSRELSFPDYDYFYTSDGTAGFIYMQPDGTAYYGQDTPSSDPLEWVQVICGAGREKWLAGGPIPNPTTGEIWIPEPCSTSTPGSPGGGTGGGGAM